MNRGMLVTVLWRMEGRPEATEPAAFADVTPDAWYADAVAWAAENGIVNGYNADSFGPTDDLTREQILTILHRWAGLPEPPEGEETPAYPDGTDAHGWAIDALRWATAAGVLDAEAEEAAAPRDPMSRAAVADVLMRYDTLVRPKLVEMTEKEAN